MSANTRRPSRCSAPAGEQMQLRLYILCATNAVDGDSTRLRHCKSDSLLRLYVSNSRKRCAAGCVLMAMCTRLHTAADPGSSSRYFCVMSSVQKHQDLICMPRLVEKKPKATRKVGAECAITSEGPDIGRRRLQQDEVGERARFCVICLHKHLPPVLMNGQLGAAAGLLGPPHSCTHAHAATAGSASQHG